MNKSNNIEENYLEKNYYWRIEEILLKDISKSDLYAYKKEYKEILIKEEKNVSLDIEKFVLGFWIIDALENMFLREYWRIFLWWEGIEVSQKVFNRLDTFYKLNHLKTKKWNYKKIDISSISLLDIMNKYAVKIPKNLKNNMKCPFITTHNDKTASFRIYKKTQSFNCFGCSKGGWVVQFVQYMENLDDNKKAFKKLINLIK